MFKLFSKKTKKCEEQPLPEGATSAVPGDLGGDWMKDLGGVSLSEISRALKGSLLRGDTIGDPKKDLYAVIHGKGMSRREFKQVQKEYRERGDAEC
jgi:hypothetical protein